MHWQGSALKENRRFPGDVQNASYSRGSCWNSILLRFVYMVKMVDESGMPMELLMPMLLLRSSWTDVPEAGS